jgi:hypothetical protein
MKHKADGVKNLKEESQKTLGELFMDFINNSSLIDTQPGCFHGIQSVGIQMYTRKDGKTFVFHAEGRRKP